MENKLIVLWGSEPRAGCKTLGRAMASQLADESRFVLLVNADPYGQAHSEVKASLKDPSTWVPRFSTLSPVLLRNYLSESQDSYAHLDLPAAPAASVSKDLFALLRKAFEWILWTSPVEWSSESLTVLDNADLLLWVSRASENSQRNLKRYFEKLASLHYANAFSQIVLNQIPPAPPRFETSQAFCEGKTILVRIPQELPRGVLFQQGVQRLLGHLQSRKDLYFSSNGSQHSADKIPPETIIEDIKQRIKPHLMEAGASPPAEVAQKTLDRCLAEDATIAPSRDQRQELYSRVLNEVLGLGALEPLLKDPEISEVMVNGRSSIFIEKRGKLYPCGVQFSSESHLRTVIDRIVAPIGRRVDESMPLCDARLADGSRVNIVLPPLALDGPTLTIRKFMAKVLSLDELVQWHSLSPAMVDFLRSCILLRKNMVVAGGTGSGKTTLLNALSGVIPNDERIVTIEDAAELRLQKPHVVRLESRPPNAEGEGAIPIRRLVINALRMRPDRIVVGECRGGEALDMLQAMNTGHDGSLTTLHANSPRDALRRLETLVLMADIDLPVRVVREQIQSAVNILIQQTRLSDGSRKITSITEVTGMEGDILTTQEIYRYRTAPGGVEGTFEKTGFMPSFAKDIPRTPSPFSGEGRGEGILVQ